MTLENFGNSDILKLNKTAFLCSRKVSASAILKCYDWAIEQREKRNCIVSGFHSQIEKDVLHYLLKGTQPIIVALARGLKDILEPEFIKPIEQGRMLIISPFERDIKRVTEQTALVRNKMMLDMADNVVIGFASAEGKLNSLLKENKKPLLYLS
jgi:predicted Rossmann fold nucleotide-binding protein DprA/Smf involved in DNA uptake